MIEEAETAPAPIGALEAAARSSKRWRLGRVALRSLAERYDVAHRALESASGFSAEAELRATLSGPAPGPEVNGRSATVGSWLMRTELAKLLIASPSSVAGRADDPRPALDRLVRGRLARTPERSWWCPTTACFPKGTHQSDRGARGLSRLSPYWAQLPPRDSEGAPARGRRGAALNLSARSRIAEKFVRASATARRRVRQSRLKAIDKPQSS